MMMRHGRLQKELRPEGKPKVSDMEELYFHERIELLNDVQRLTSLMRDG